jgi:hypothetical protein
MSEGREYEGPNFFKLINIVMRLIWESHRFKFEGKL